MRPDPTTMPGDSAERIERWLEIMRISDKLLLAGLRRKVGPDGDLATAYREWYENHMREHDIAVERMARQGSDVAQEPSHAR